MVDESWKAEFDAYIRAITPNPHDPTYSVLKAHLKFEERLRAHLDQVLAYPKALEGARLSFAQLLAFARACSHEPDDWCWVAVSKLNKLRNTLAHETGGGDLRAKIDDYVRFVVRSTGEDLPEADTPAEEVRSASQGDRLKLFSGLDMVTGGLYSYFGVMLSARERRATIQSSP